MPILGTVRLFTHVGCSIGPSSDSIRSSYGMGLSPLHPREHAHSSSRKGGALVYNEKD